jgi:GNAT superfamily N-acetyltransferase
MSILIKAINANQLDDYARIPMVCEVRSVLAIDDFSVGMSNPALREQPIEVPYIKGYDTYADGGPLAWPKRFDISKWGLWIGVESGEAVGGVAVAWNTPGIDILDGRSDVAVLWDIRVRATHGRQGVGSLLFREAVRWARSKDCRMLKMETQNVNIGACRFYAQMGCFVGQIDRLAYRQQPEVASEIMLVWHLNL